MPEAIHPPDEALLIGRAVRAYGSPAIRLADVAIRHLAGRDYVVLPLADGREPVVYRIRPDRTLRQMIAPPPELVS